MTRIFSGSTRRALERPNWPSAPIPPPLAAARRAISTKMPTIKSVGPNPSRISANSDVVEVVDCALISTSLEISSVSSWVPFQNAGTCVANSVVAVAVLEPTG